jgi:hypothetical protein
MRHLVALLWLVAVPMMLVAQDRLRIVSPEVRKDRSVVFRLWLPAATAHHLPPPLAAEAEGFGKGGR